MSSPRVRFEGVALLFIALVAVVRCNIQCRSNRCNKEAQYLSSCLKLSEDPCQDFYSFACGNFININPVLGGPNSWGPFEIAQNATNHAINAILSSPKLRTDSGALRKAKTMYAACMDKETREQRGLHPLLHMIKNLGLGGWPLISDTWNGSVTWSHVARIMAKYGFPLFFDVSVMPHPDNSSVDIIHLSAPSLILAAPLHRTPRRQEGAMDILELPENDDIIQYLLDVTMEVRNHAGATHVRRSSIKKELLDVLDFARKLQDKTTELFNLDPSADTVPIGSLANGDGQIDWLDFLQTVFQDSGVRLTSKHEVYTGGSSHIKHILQLFKDSDSRLLANYIVSRLVMQLAPETTERMRGYLTRFYQKWQLIPDDNPSWLYCTNKVRDYPNTGLVAAVAHEYEKNHFHAHYMRRVKQLVKDLRVSTKELLDENNWVDEETKRLVTEKLENMSVLPGFSEWISNVSSLDRFYDKLIIHKDDHFGNVARMRAFLQASNLAILGNENYPNLKWSFSPFLINAFYDLSQNSVTLPAGIMQHPFYTGQDNIPLHRRPKKGHGNVDSQKYRTKSSKGTRKHRSTQSILLALDYGRFGSIVGHEITHAFDGEGYLYDKSEQMNGWSNHMALLFLKNGLCFMKQYGRQQQLQIFQDTLNEDIADNGGLRKA